MISAKAQSASLVGVSLTVRVDDIGTFYVNGAPIYYYPIGTWNTQVTVPISPSSFSSCGNFIAFLDENVNTAIGTMWVFQFFYSDGTSFCYSSEDAYNAGTIKLYNQRSDQGDPARSE